MATILEFAPKNPVVLGTQLRNARTDARLSLAQAAAALGISPITLDGWEQGRKPQIAVEEAEARYEKFRNDTNSCRKTGNNLLFGVFPVRIARVILELSIEEIADEFGYSVSSWTKMEANARLMPKETVAKVEHRVNEAWNKACSGMLV